MVSKLSSSWLDEEELTTSIAKVKLFLPKKHEIEI
jgi:hypothetical protein